MGVATLKAGGGVGPWTCLAYRRADAGAAATVMVAAMDGTDRPSPVVDVVSQVAWSSCCSSLRLLTSSVPELLETDTMDELGV
jgi:hypothetical protein